MTKYKIGDLVLFKDTYWSRHYAKELIDTFGIVTQINQGYIGPFFGGIGYRCYSQILQKEFDFMDDGVERIE